ncbi:interleukin-18 receptor accessory protein-like isoform X2 [Antennarius striatus]|uniref:interleukin-18 receptor accessory protein-like isoform X2 n=1 Tax=Antennarius striatus TaxID=241820 RepID=UPI0035B0C5B6
MQTGYFLFFAFFPIYLEGCCVENHQKKRTGCQQDITHHHYKVVEGELFMMPCFTCVNRHAEMVCFRTDEDGNESSFDCGRTFLADKKHSGKYMCATGGGKLSIQLEVVKKKSLQCFNPEARSQELRVHVGGRVSCPGVNCSDNTDVIWSKGNKAVSAQPRASCEEYGWLHLCQVSELDSGIYFCDRQIMEKGFKWILRRSVNVTVVPNLKRSYPPRITYPKDGETEIAVLGQPYTLECRIYFPFEMPFSPNVSWYMHYGGNMDNMTVLQMESHQQDKAILEEFKVTQRAIIKEVTLQHLSSAYSCIATNANGSSRVTIKLKNAIKGKWLSWFLYPVTSLLLIAGLGVLLHVKWLEVQLIYRSHFQHGKHSGAKKEFDVFLSCVWSPPSAEVEGDFTPSSLSGPDTNEANLRSMEPLNSEEGKAFQREVEVLLPQVLEEQWGYRLCLLERDVLPGGAYTNDVVLAIERSRMLICLLSAEYFSNTNAVFVLETGIQALLQNSTLNLLLIWTNRTSATADEMDCPLPPLVQRALKVLPSLDWTPGKSDRATRNFWRSLRKAMPRE